MRRHTALLLAELLLLAALWKLCCPEGETALRAWAETLFFPEGRETVEAWGRALGGEGERVPALRQGEQP